MDRKRELVQLMYRYSRQPKSKTRDLEVLGELVQFGNFVKPEYADAYEISNGVYSMAVQWGPLVAGGRGEDPLHAKNCASGAILELIRRDPTILERIPTKDEVSTNDQ